MKKIALALFLLSLPVLGSTETTTVGGTIQIASGAVATGGTVVCELTSPGTAPDTGSGALVQVVSRCSGTISGSGVLTGMACVPNDVITPSNTAYNCTVTVSGPVRTSFKEIKKFATAPDPVTYGASQTLTSYPGYTASGVTGGVGAVQGSNGAGGLQDTGVSASGGALTAKSLRADGSVHAYDTGGDGTADTLPARVDAIAAARAHAAMYSADPDAYLKGGVFDGWLEIARNYGPTNLSLASSFTQQMQQCWQNSCATAQSIICLSASSTFAVGDSFVLGPNDNSTGRFRSHVVKAIANGTGGSFPSASGCPNGTNNQITIAPSIGTDESVTGTSYITSLWNNPSHLSTAGYAAFGRAIGKASRTRDGVHGPNLLVNGNATYYTANFADGWEYTGSPTVASNDWFPAGQASYNVYHCTEGSGNKACFFYTGGSSSDVIRNPGQPSWIVVQPGARYVFSCAFTGAVANDTVALEADIANDGTLDEIVPVSLTSASAVTGPASYPAWVYATYDIPDQTSRVRVRIRRAGTTTLQVDGCSFRKAAGLLASDSINSPANYLINDPGSRNIVLLADSWGVDGTTGTAFAAGLAAELQSRLGRDVSAQIKVNGKSGITTNGMLTENTCTATSHLGGSLNCWQDAVEQYDPLYVIVVLGTNDVYGSVTAAQYVTNILQIRARLMSMGAIPIIVSAFPVGDTTGVGSKYDLAHQYRDAVRAAILGDMEGFQSSTFRTSPTSSASAAYNPLMPAASGTVVLDPFPTTPTTAAGYYQSGDSQGLQFFPGARRSYAEVLSLKQRGESPNQAPTSVRVFVLGDSISAMSTRSALRTWDKRFRLGGAGFDPLDSLTYAGAPEIATRTISGWTTTYGTNGGGETAPTTQLQMGIGGGSLFQSGTTGANVQVAYALTKIACNKIRIWYAKFAGAGAFQWRRDGGAWTTVATANASTDAGYVQVSLESTPIAGHTIDIGFNNSTTGQPGGNGVYIYGIESYTDYTGGNDQFDTVVPVWMSHGGATASRWASYVGSNQILTTFFTTVAPTQGFIALGTNDACTTRGGGATNDCTAGDSATTFSTNMQTIITALTSYLPKKTDIVLQSPFARGYDDCSGEMASFATRIDGYRTALFALATTNGVSVWDMRKYWPGFTDANSLGMYNAGDCTHPHYWSQALISSGWADLISRPKGWQSQEQWRQARNCDFNNVGIYGTATIDMGHCDFLLAAGNGTLGTINTCSSDTVGRRITIGCQSGATWTAATPGAGNVKLHTSAFTCGTPASQYASISFICSPDGFRWIETGRSKGM